MTESNETFIVLLIGILVLAGWPLGLSAAANWGTAAIRRTAYKIEFLSAWSLAFTSVAVFIGVAILVLNACHVSPPRRPVQPMPWWGAFAGASIVFASIFAAWRTVGISCRLFTAAREAGTKTLTYWEWDMCYLGGALTILLWAIVIWVASSTSFACG